MTKLTTINFHGATLVAIAGDRPENTLVAMKTVVEGMGLDWTYQSRKLQSHPVLSTCVAVTAIQMQGDDQAREHTFLALNRLNFWLATIHPDRIKNESVRKAVIIYQTELADVAFNHFFGKAIASQPSDVTIADIEQNMRSVMGGISKRVLGKGLEPVISTLEAQSTHTVSPDLKVSPLIVRT